MQKKHLFLKLCGEQIVLNEAFKWQLDRHAPHDIGRFPSYFVGVVEDDFVNGFGFIQN